MVRISIAFVTGWWFYFCFPTYPMYYVSYSARASLLSCVEKSFLLLYLRVGVSRRIDCLAMSEPMPFVVPKLKGGGRSSHLAPVHAFDSFRPFDSFCSPIARLVFKAWRALLFRHVMWSSFIVLRVTNNTRFLGFLMLTPARQLAVLSTVVLVELTR